MCGSLWAARAPARIAPFSRYDTNNYAKEDCTMYLRNDKL